ncbi:hypothetical protein TMRH483_01123 [Qipengyuania sp. 483]
MPMWLFDFIDESIEKFPLDQRSKRSDTFRSVE